MDKWTTDYYAMDYYAFVWCILNAEHADCEQIKDDAITENLHAELEFRYGENWSSSPAVDDIWSEYQLLSPSERWKICRAYLLDDKYSAQLWHIRVSSEAYKCVIANGNLAAALTIPPCYGEILRNDTLERKSCILSLLDIDYLGFEFACKFIKGSIGNIVLKEGADPLLYTVDDIVSVPRMVEFKEGDRAKIPPYSIFREYYTYIDILLTGAVQKKELLPFVDAGKEYFMPAHFFAWALANGLTIPEPLQPLLLQFMKKPPYGATPSGGGSKKKRRGAVTQKEAAEALGKKDERTIRNWLNGIGTPPGFPGLEDSTAFYCFVERQKSASRMRIAARAMNRAAPGGDMNEFSQGVDL